MVPTIIVPLKLSFSSIVPFKKLSITKTPVQTAKIKEIPYMYWINFHIDQ